MLIHFDSIYFLFELSLFWLFMLFMKNFIAHLGSDLHLYVLKKIGIVTVILSIFVAIAAYYYELEQIDNFVVNLAVKESEDIFNDIELLNENKAILTVKCNQLNNLHFPIIEVYNLKKQKIIECTDTRSELIESRFQKYPHGFLDHPVYDKHLINKELYLRVIAPIRSDKGINKVGYFEGIYHVDPEVLSQINTSIFFTIGLAIICIFATGTILFPIITRLNDNLIKKNHDLLGSNIQLMEVLGSAIAKRDSDTNIHNYRVTIYAIYLGEKMGLSPHNIQNLIIGSFLHDVGKIGISDTILLKQGRLTEDEFKIMKTHVELGLDIIAKAPWLQAAQDVIQYHHEKYDGTGYIQGLKGEKIPVNARIFAVVDVFDALTSKRPYKEPFSFEDSIRILEDGRDKHFDGKILSVFEEIVYGIYSRLTLASDKEIELELNALVERHFFNYEQKL